MDPLSRALKNRKARRENLNGEGTAYHGTNASSSPQDTRWWRSVPRDVRIQVPDQFAFMTRIREIVTTYPQAFDDATGTFLFPWLDKVQETSITEIDRAFNDAIFQEKGLYIEDARRAKNSTHEEQRLHAEVTLHDKQYRAARDHLLGVSGATPAWDEKTPASDTPVSMSIPVPASLNTPSNAPGAVGQAKEDLQRVGGSTSLHAAPAERSEGAPTHLHGPYGPEAAEDDPMQPGSGLKSA